MTAKISFLVPDISAPSVGAALKLSRFLEPEYQTEIVGPDFGGGICSLYKGSYPFKAVPAGRLYRMPDYLWERNRMVDAVSGDVVIAVKGFSSTVPVSLGVRKKRNIPAVVYLDEWDGALWYSLSTKEKLRCWLSHGHHPMEPCYHPLVERSIRKVDAVLSTTRWLQHRFGGHIVHAGVDCEVFKPQPADDVASLRKLLGLDGCYVIVFGGVVRPHKGVEEILDAMVHLGRDNVKLLVVGPVTEHLDVFLKSSEFGRRIVVAGDAMNSGSNLNAEIHKKMPLYLDAGDLVVLPLRDTPLAQSQMPIKIFEAMAMGKPVIGTAVSDLPHMLEGCGWIVPPGDPEALANAMAYAMDHPEETAQKGSAARERALKEFSADVCSNQLRNIMGGLLP